MTPTIPSVSLTALPLEGEQSRILVQELDRFASVTGAGGQHAALRSAVESGEVPGIFVSRFTRFLEGLLESGTVGRNHGPGLERSLLELYRKTERGAAAAAAVEEVNRALSALQGQRLENLAFRATLPGAYQLVVETDRCHIRLEIDRRGVGAKDVAVTA